MRVLIGTVLSAIAISCSAGIIWACAWDSDTLRAESEGLPGVLDIITGRFERNPPLYYEMRIARNEKIVAEDPSNLAAYDDLGVGNDRLGNSAAAIQWMERKHEQLQKTPDDEHLYRYHANLGTFYAHKWFRDGADREEIASLKKAVVLIQEAININPDAHFGREVYQLMFLEWLQANEPMRSHDFTKRVYVSFAEGDSFLKLSPEDEKQAADPHYGNHWEREQSREAVTGVSGLVALGNAWESPDIFYALACLLDSAGGIGEYGGKDSLGLLALLRTKELVASGGYRHIEFPEARSLGTWDFRQEKYLMVHDREREALEEDYRKLRVAADEWHAHRTEFMMSRLEKGMHPDTHSDFWKGYKEGKRPNLRKSQAGEVSPKVYFTIYTPLGALAVLAFLAWFLPFRKRSRALASVPDSDDTDVAGPDSAEL